MTALTDNKSAGLISIVADDGKMEDYSILMPLLDRYSVRANSAIVSDWVGKPGCMDISQISELVSKGWEMLCHSKTHSVPLDTLSGQRLKEEIVDAKLQLNDLGIDVRHFCYPWGSRSPAAKQLIAQNYGCAIRVGGGANSFHYDRFAIKRSCIDDLDVSDVCKLAVYKREILSLVQKPLWIVYMVHPAESMRRDSVIEGMSQLMEHSVSCGIPVVTISEAIALIASRVGSKRCRDVGVFGSSAVELMKDMVVGCFTPGHIQRVRRWVDMCKEAVADLKKSTHS